MYNLVGLAKELVPDQKVINAVGIEANIEGQRTSMLLGSTRDELNEIILPLESESVETEYTVSDEWDTVVGVLQFADATKDQVRLLTDGGKWWRIAVPEGLAEDVVKPYFGDRVRVKGRHIVKKKKGQRLYLHDISPADEDITFISLADKRRDELVR